MKIVLNCRGTRYEVTGILFRDPADCARSAELPNGCLRIVVETPEFRGEGNTLDEALCNIQEAICKIMDSGGTVACVERPETGPRGPEPVSDAERIRQLEDQVARLRECVPGGLPPYDDEKSAQHMREMKFRRSKDVPAPTPDLDDVFEAGYEDLMNIANSVSTVTRHEQLRLGVLANDMRERFYIYNQMLELSRKNAALWRDHVSEFLVARQWNTASDIRLSHDTLLESFKAWWEHFGPKYELAMVQAGSDDKLVAETIHNFQTYQRAINLWGHRAQMRQLQEECCELGAIINQFDRLRCGAEDVAGEIADVIITCEQAKLIVGPALVDEMLAFKRVRLRDRIVEAEKAQLVQGTQGSTDAASAPAPEAAPTHGAGNAALRRSIGME